MPTSARPKRRTSTGAQSRTTNRTGRTRNTSSKKKKKSGGVKKRAMLTKSGEPRRYGNKYGHTSPGGKWISNRTATG